MWRLQFAVMDDGHGATGVSHQFRTDRAEQTASQSAAPVGADDDQLGIFGAVDECRAGGRKLQFAIDCYLRSIVRDVMGDLRCVCENAATLSFLPPRHLFLAPRPATMSELRDLARASR